MMMWLLFYSNRHALNNFLPNRTETRCRPNGT